MSYYGPGVTPEECRNRCSQNTSCTAYLIPTELWPKSKDWCERFTSVGATGDGRTSFECFTKTSTLQGEGSLILQSRKFLRGTLGSFCTIKISTITLFIISVICPTVTILHTKHSTFGDKGQYFYVSKEELSKMIGIDKFNAIPSTGNVITVIQKGSQSWEGRVRIWSRD